MKTPDGYLVIESIKQAFDTFAAMELPIEEQKCTISREAATALFATFEQVKRERDAAVRQMLEADKNNPFACMFCKHDEVCDGRMYICGDCNMNCPCNTCCDHSNWQWRGVKDGDQGD